MKKYYSMVVFILMVFILNGCGLITMPSQVTNIHLNKTYVELIEDETEQIIITFEPDGESSNVSWSSADSSIATVNNGLIKAIKAGNTVITAKSSGMERKINVIVIYKDQSKVLRVSQPEEQSLDIEQGNMLNYEKSFLLVDKGQSDFFNYKAETSNGKNLEKGLFLFESDNFIWWSIKDMEGNKIYQSNKAIKSVLVSLNIGTIYVIEVERGNFSGRYNISISAPNGVSDLTDYTEFNDRLWYSGQQGYYTFTAKSSGFYRLEADNKVAWFIEDELGNSIAKTSYNSIISSYSNDNHIEFELTEGKTYNIRIRKGGYTGNHTFTIHKPLGKINITNKSQVFDEMRFKSQKNIYEYIASETKNYNISSNQNTQITILDSYGNKVGLSKTTNDLNYKVSLKANEKYTIIIEQSKYLGPYIFEIN